jgi:hypothetical protein
MVFISYFFISSYFKTMAYQEIKIQSNDAGPWTVNNNLVSVTIPDYIMASDLSKSAIILNMQLMNGTAALGLYDAGFNNGYAPKVMVKNCRMISDKGGSLEDVQASNVLTCNLQKLAQDFEDVRANEWKGQGVTSINGYSIGSFIQKINSGSVSSTAQTYFKIPLKDLFGLGSMTQFPNRKFGNTRIEIEFEDDTTNIETKAIYSSGQFKHLSISYLCYWRN